MKRFLIGLTGFILTASILTSIAVWIILRSWLPTTGKTRLIQTLEEEYPIHVSINSMRYNPWHGAILEEVTVQDLSGRTLTQSPRITAQVRWIPFLLAREAVFRSHVELSAPCRMGVDLNGTYALRQKKLTLRAATEGFTLSECAGWVLQEIPAGVSDARIRFDMRTQVEPGLQPTLTGRIDADDVRLAQGPIAAELDATLNGRVTVPSKSAAQESGRAWDYDTTVEIRNGSVTGIPRIENVTGLNAEARLTPAQITVSALKATVLGSEVHAEGSVLLAPSLTFDFGIKTQADLSRLSMLLPTGPDHWQLEGIADVRASCRGPWAVLPDLDCQAQADLKTAGASGARLPYPITDGQGSLRYDHLSRRLTLVQLSGRIHEQPLAVDGTITFQRPAMLMFGVTGELDLAVAEPWLPKEAAVHDLSGQAKLDLLVQGPLKSLKTTGRVELARVHLQAPGLTEPIDALDGVLLLNEEDFQLSAASFTFRGVPIKGDVTYIPTEPANLTATMTIPEGGLNLRSRISPAYFFIDDAQAWMGESRLAGAGRISRVPQQASELSLQGELDLGRLNTLAFFPLPAIEPWNLQGFLKMRAQYKGLLCEWQTASLNTAFESKALSVKGVPIHQLMGNVNQNRGKLLASLASSSVAGGPATIELALDHQQPGTGFTFRGLINGLQLEQLRETVPAWKDRDISGVASMQASIDGIWDKRASWQGEGYFKAAGSKLGNMPLLDKLFRGIYGMLGEAFGLDSLRRAEITSVDTVWRMSNERILTDNLRLGGIAGQEPVAVYATGSVGLDGTLDFLVEPELSEQLILEAPNTRTLASSVLKTAGTIEKMRRVVGRHRLTGTIQQPDYKFEFSFEELFKNLGPAPGQLIEGLQGAIDSLFGGRQ